MLFIVNKKNQYYLTLVFGLCACDCTSDKKVVGWAILTVRTPPQTTAIASTVILIMFRLVILRTPLSFLKKTLQI